MPAGVTWGAYLRFSCAAMLSMMAGAQLVHMYYRPLQDMAGLVEKEKQRLLAENAAPHSSPVNKNINGISVNGS